MANAESYPNDRLRTSLKSKGISQSRISFDLGVGRSRLNRIALGWDMPGDELKSRIGAYLGMDIADLSPERETDEIDRRTGRTLINWDEVNRHLDFFIFTASKKDVSKMQIERMNGFIRLAKEGCANYSETGPHKIKGYCCMEPGCSHRCLLMSGNPCKWFVEAVLPLDPDLELEWQKLFAANSTPKSIFRMCECGKHFKPKSNRQQYCPECAKEVHKKKNRDRVRRCRLKAG